MIVKTNAGVFTVGQLAKDPELKHVGQHNRAVLKASLRYSSKTDEAGKVRGEFLGLDLWNGAEDLDGMLAKGDSVLVFAKEIKSREYNDETYYSVSADSMFVSAQTVFRWMQQIVDMIPAAPPQDYTFTPVDQPPNKFVESNDNPIAGGELYEGEQLSAYEPRSAAASQQSPADDLIDGEPEDLPF